MLNLKKIQVIFTKLGGNFKKFILPNPILTNRNEKIVNFCYTAIFILRFVKIIKS